MTRKFVDVPTVARPAHGFYAKPSDLIAHEPTQSVVDDFVLAVPLAAALADPDFLLAAHTRLKPGDRVWLLRYADASRRRLAEVAEIVIAESSAGAVTFALAGAIIQMPPPAERVVETVEEALRVVRVPHDFRLVEEVEEQNRVPFFKVTDGDGRVIEGFKLREAAQEHLDYVLAAWPDYVVANEHGEQISPRFVRPEDAAGWLAAEQKRRQVEQGGRA